MTSQEIDCIKELSGDVKELSTEVRTLSGDLREHIVRDSAEWAQRANTHAEVFGIDGDPTKPGLKGQMRDVRSELGSHEDQLRAIYSVYQSAKARGITWLSGATIALIGAIAGALFKHFWK